MAKLQLKIDGEDFTGLLVAGTPVIKEQLNACCRTLEFSLMLSGIHQNLEGHEAELYYGGKRWFIGFIRKQKDTNTGVTNVKVYDYLYLFSKRDDDYYFKNQTATQIIKTMAKKAGVKIYKLENTKVTIKYVFYKKGSPDKIAVDVLARTWKGGGDKFWFRYNPVHNGIQLHKRTVPTEIWVFKTGDNLISATRERSIEDMYNTVKVINRETGKTVTKVNAKNKALYGNTQYYEEVSDKDTNLAKYAASKLKSLSKISTTLTMTGVNTDGAMGQFYVGDPIYVEEKNTGMVGGYWVRNVTHNFLSNNLIRIDFDLTKTEDIPDIQYKDAIDKSKNSSCKGQTTAAVHVRKGAGTKYASKGTFKKGTSLKILGKSGAWYEVEGKINKKDVTGYSHKAYVKITSGKVPS